MIAALFGDLIPYIVAALAALAGLWGWGKVKKREGAVERDAKRAAEDAADFAETIKEVSHEKASTEPVDAVRDRMRDRANRKP